MRLQDAFALIGELSYKYWVQGAPKPPSILMIGPPGIGKTEIIHQLRDRMATVLKEPIGLKVEHLADLDVVDVRGFLMPTKSDAGELVSVFSRPPIFPATDAPEKGYLFLDEFTQAGLDMQKVASRLILDGQIGDFKLPPGWIVVAAGNGEQHRAGANKMLSINTNRVMRLDVEPDADGWVKWAQRSGVHPFIVAFAKFKPGLVFSGIVPQKDEPFCTSRSLVRANQVMLTMGDMKSNLVNTAPSNTDEQGLAQANRAFHAVKGLVGEGAATELWAFLKVVAEAPTFEDIIKNPSGVKVPERLDVTYATMQMCLHRVTKDTGDAVFTYIRRMTKDFQLPAVVQLLEKVPTLQTTTAFSRWVVENAEFAQRVLKINAEMKGRN